MSFQKFFLISRKKLWIIIVSWVVAVILHNFLSNLLVDPPINGSFFFVMSIIVIPLYFLIVLIYSLIKCPPGKSE